MRTRLWIAAVAILCATGCTKTDENAPPKGADSADDIGYALEYPEKVDDSVADLDSGEQELDADVQAFEGYPDSIKEPTDYDKLADIYRAADEAGRSEAYVKVARENEAIMDFVESDDGILVKKVAGGVQFTAKQQGCSADLGGAAAGAMKRTISKRLEERMKAANDAHRLIDENEEALGKKNTAALHKQVDEIAAAAYLAYIKLPTARAELRTLMAKRSRIISTLDSKIAADKKITASADASDADKKAAEKRITEMEAAKEKLEQSQQAHQDALKTLDKRITDAQKKYDTAFDALLEKVSAKGKGAAKAEGDAGVEASGSIKAGGKAGGETKGDSKP